MAYLGLEVQKPNKPLKKKSTYIFNKTSYDQIITDEEKDTRLPELLLEQAIKPYTQSGSTLTGTGTNGKFKATTTGTYTAFTIGGVSYAVKAGSETEIELTSGVWYSFILDTGAKTINFKAGGAGLNFKIVGGTTQPASPKENTIWVNTDTAIGEWQFSFTQPTTRADGTALKNSDLWVAIDIISNVGFNALKKCKMEIYPVKTMQFITNEWVEKPAKIYIDGNWLDLIGIVDYFYKNGNEYTGITGGWELTGTYGSIRETNILVGYEASMTKFESSCSTVDFVSLTHLETLSIHFSSIISTHSSGKGYVKLFNSYGDLILNSQIFNGSVNLSNYTHQVDVSAISGKCKISIHGSHSDGGYRQVSMVFDEVKCQ